MAISKTFLLVVALAPLLLISAEVSAHRDLAETTTTTSESKMANGRPWANTDGYYGRDHGHGGRGGHGGHSGHGGRGGRGGHGLHGVETETGN